MKRDVVKLETLATDLLIFRAFCLLVGLGSIMATATAFTLTKSKIRRLATRISALREYMLDTLRAHGRHEPAV